MKDFFRHNKMVINMIVLINLLAPLVLSNHLPRSDLKKDLENPIIPPDHH